MLFVALNLIFTPNFRQELLRVFCCENFVKAFQGVAYATDFNIAFYKIKMPNWEGTLIFKE
ncbi:MULTISPECIES: hypothetical protein [Campylobacter]|uniref:hypothetical protein n=1 Tax=Campylobacter TaxID=194 RepID=UPI000A33621B|nr:MULTISPECIES: hypothetical protein [Campylobacter]MCR8679317.1 hypothetical protein [Campylobacter sp. RM19072]